MWPIKNFEKHFMAHQYMPKIFHGPHKDPLAPPPTYLMYSPLFTTFSDFFSTDKTLYTLLSSQPEIQKS